MKSKFLGVLALLVAPAMVAPPLPAASREIQELQRDVGLLQQQVKDLQMSQNEKFAGLSVLVQQALDAANKANTNVAVIQNGFQQNIRDQESKVVTPVVGLGTRMDQMSNEMRTLQGAVSDLTSLMSKLQAQLVDMNNAVKVLQAPPAAPPSPSAAPGPGPAASAAPTISATDLYANAMRDRSSNKPDLALEEFAQYLKDYGNTELAPNAQYYIGYIHYTQGQYEDALKEFDMVLEKYTDNNKTPDALFYKGMTLGKLGRRTQGAEEFRQLLKRFPTHDLARQACSQLTSMGYNCPAARAATPARKKK
jgi:tol-pal system protein YbgF